MSQKVTRIRSMLATGRCRAESRYRNPVILITPCFVLADDAGTESRRPGRSIVSKALAVRAIVFGCLAVHGAGVQAYHVDVQFDDGPRIEVVKWTDWNKADIETVRLAANLFPNLSADVVADLSRRGCTIPQPWLATEPANVVYGRFMDPGQVDVAVLCSIERVSSILVYGGNSTDHVAELATMADKVHLQDVGRGRIGFSRQIGVADSERVRDQRTSLGRLAPPRTDIDGIEDFFLEKASTIWYWHEAEWLELPGSD